MGTEKKTHTLNIVTEFKSKTYNTNNHIHSIMASDRPKRSNAGNRMSKLIEEQAEEQDNEADEFYKTTYGGFEEDEEDNDYEEEEAEEDIVDSDFSLSEHDEEEEGSDEESKKVKPSGNAAPKVKKPTVKKVIEPVK